MSCTAGRKTLLDNSIGRFVEYSYISFALMWWISHKKERTIVFLRSLHL